MISGVITQCVWCVFYAAQDKKQNLQNDKRADLQLNNVTIIWIP